MQTLENMSLTVEIRRRGNCLEVGGISPLHLAFKTGLRLAKAFLA